MFFFYSHRKGNDGLFKEVSSSILSNKTPTEHNLLAGSKPCQLHGKKTWRSHARRNSVPDPRRDPLPETERLDSDFSHQKGALQADLPDARSLDGVTQHRTERAWPNLIFEQCDSKIGRRPSDVR